jgi:hypothetical protein
MPSKKMKMLPVFPEGEISYKAGVCGKCTKISTLVSSESLFFRQVGRKGNFFGGFDGKNNSVITET